MFALLIKPKSALPLSRLSLPSGFTCFLYEVFKVHFLAYRQMGLSGPFPSCSRYISCDQEKTFKLNGLEWAFPQLLTLYFVNTLEKDQLKWA